MSNSTRLFEGFLLGGVLGFLSGILFAPKSGADLRKQIADDSNELYKQANDSLSGLKEMTDQTFQDVQHVGQDAFRKASDTISGARQQVNKKLDDLTGQGAKVLVDDVEQRIDR
jgi:gas vesicle protein